MRKCQSCHRSTFDSAKFCHHCGAKMIVETLDCQQCNHKNVVDAKFCENCGFDLLVPTPPSVSTPKKRSIFDDIEEENDNTAENTPTEIEEELKLSFPESMLKKETIEEEPEDDVEEELELVFTESDTEIEPETEEVEKGDNKNKSDAYIDEDESDSLEFTFEKTPAETEKPKFNKADIPFEIVENLPEPDDFFNEIEEEDNETEEQKAEASREIIEEEVSEEAIFEEIIQKKEQQEKENENENLEEGELEEFDLNTPPPINDLFEENPNHNLEEEIFKKFAGAFEKQIKTEQNAAKYNVYVDRFEESDFKLSFEFRVKQLAEEIQKTRQNQSILKDEKTLLNQAFSELIDYFIIRYCEDINQIQLSEKILQYQNIAPENIDLSAMILDYLNFDNEDEQVDFDFIKMPMKRLKNASKNFLFPEKGEKIFFICDQSILGSGKEGFAMTEKAIYWKMQFEPAQRVYYKKLQSIEPQKDWININEMFFNANPSLNIKMMKLLKKLKWMK